MSAANIAVALGDASREGRSWRCRCPLHGGRSLVLHDGDAGRVLVTCWGGCDRLDVLAELRRRGLLDRRAEYAPFVAAPSDRTDEASRIARAGAILRQCIAAPDIIARYLAGRGIVLDRVPECLRWHPRCPRPDGAQMPAMVAPVEHVERGFVGIHRTYITADHRRHDRATLGPIGGGAVRFGGAHAGEWLAVAEGVETALSVALACAMPAWAALSASGIRALILPLDVKHIVICADHDVGGTGGRAAHTAAQRWLAEGRRVRIAMPPQRGSDFNDLLTGRFLTNINEAAHVV